MRCCRCSRPLQHAVHLAGMTLGRECRRAIVDAVLQREPAEQGGEADPRQRDFFEVPDLFGAPAAEARA